MPIYDYTCQDCDTKFEELIRNAQDEAGVRCSSCGSTRVERQMSSFAMGKGRSASSSASSSSRSGCSGGSCGSCRSSCCH